MDIAVEFRELIAALNKAGVEYAVCGAARPQDLADLEKLGSRP